MKKYLPYLLLLLMVGGSLAVFVAQNWDPYRNVPQVSLLRLNNAEAEWYSAGVMDYRVLVLVRFSTEQRRYEVEVRSNELYSAQSARWDEAAEVWQDFAPITDEEAAFFTVPGMFNMIRSELLNEEVEREVVRMDLAQGQAYPALIYMGDILQEGIPAEDTHLIIEVLEFDPLDS